jgi:hypothetical protein
MFVASTDVFEKFVYRKENVESYTAFSREDKLYGRVSDLIVQALNTDEDFIKLNRFFLCTGYPSILSPPWVGLQNINLNNMLILVEDYRLPVLTCYHYKDYVFRNSLN